MKKKTIIKKIASLAVFLILLALAIVYGWSAMILNKTYSAPLAAVHIPNDTASIRQGERLVNIEHCGDCHGKDLAGDRFLKFVAPNLTQIIPAYSNAEIERLLNVGIKKNGTSVYGMSVVWMYHQLTDEATTQMIAYLRTLPPLPTPPGVPDKNTYGFWRRVKLIRGLITPNAVKPDVPRPYIHYDTSPVSYGRYLAMTTCSSCHGNDLKGEPGFSPDLIIAMAYDRTSFFRLLRDGVAIGGRDNVGWMTRIAKNNLKYLNDHEIDCIYAYLKTRPTQ